MIHIKNLSLHFGTRVIFDDITFSAGEHDRIGLVGANGSGKSTLFKVIAQQQYRIPRPTF